LKTATLQGCKTLLHKNRPESRSQKYTPAQTGGRKNKIKQTKGGGEKWKKLAGIGGREKRRGGTSAGEGCCAKRGRGGKAITEELERAAVNNTQVAFGINKQRQTKGKKEEKSLK